MVAVLTVADGADGQHHLDIRTAAVQHLYGATQVVGTLVNEQYEKDGIKRIVTKIEVKEVSFGSRKRKADPSESGILETLDPAEFEEIFADEEVPF